MNEAWYERIAPDVRLTQGDIIMNCPLLTWAEGSITLTGTDETAMLRGASLAVTADVIVMTQACDLENDKVTNIVLCPHDPLEVYRQEWEAYMRQKNQNPKADAWKKQCEVIRNGYLWNLAMLNEARLGDDLYMGIRIVNFHGLYTVPRSFLESLLQRRNEPRLRLLPPYREHLSQAFARFFMRVGLPVLVNPNW